MPGMTQHGALWSGRIRSIAFYLLALSVVTSLALLLGHGSARAATTFTVNRTGDADDRNINDSVCDTSSASGRQCTLRAAIQEANDTLGVDAIDFNIAGTAGVKTISPASPLPTITKATTIDGYTQPGARANTLATVSDAVILIELNGTGAGAGTDGLRITGANSTIRGLVINRFRGDGVLIAGSGATGNRVEGNFIGTDAAGSAVQGNASSGVFIDGAPNNTVGGTDSTDGTVDGVVEARNVISGNNRDGVIVFRESAKGNRVQGNRIGTAASSTQDLGNRDFGVAISSGTNTSIGGTASGAGNIVAHHDLEGVYIAGTARGNKVQGNTITSNRSGVDIENVPENANNIVGGNASAAGNVIFGNLGSGVSVSGGEASGNSILSNRIFANGGLGIDLIGAPGVNANDTDDQDSGANGLQNFPDLTSATRSNTTTATTIRGTLDSNPGEEFTIQFFLALDGEPSNHGEGQIFLGSTTTSTDATGDGGFAFVTSGLALGQKVSATATNTASGDTSEFSANQLVVPGP